MDVSGAERLRELSPLQFPDHREAALRVLPAPEDREAVRRAEAPALFFGMTVTLALVHDDTEIEKFIATHAREPGGGLINSPESFSVTRRDVIIAAAARHSSPLIGEAIYYPGLAD
jgi:hypothetical protein